MSQDDLYRQAIEQFGAALDRLAGAYEADTDARRDLLQDIHLQVWRSFASFDGRCSMRTWVYRVAHNVAARHVVRQRRSRMQLASIEEVESMESTGPTAPESEALDRLWGLIRQLKPLDRQIIVSYLEGWDANATAEVTGLSSANVAMKIYRIKNILKRWFEEGASDAE